MHILLNYSPIKLEPDMDYTSKELELDVDIEVEI